MKYLPVLKLGLWSAIGLLSACSRPQPSENSGSPTAYQQLSPEEFEAKLAELPNEQIVDVRTPAEYQKGHLAEAMSIDFLGNQFEEGIARLDKDKPVMVYCAKGGRSTAAANRLEELGFQEVYELEGGLTRWADAQKAIAR